jgi:hypothetical protein
VKNSLEWLGVIIIRDKVSVGDSCDDPPVK